MCLALGYYGFFQNILATSNQLVIIKSGLELFTGDITGQSFTGIYDWDDKSLDLTKVVSLAMHISLEDKREVRCSFQSLKVLENNNNKNDLVYMSLQGMFGKQ